MNREDITEHLLELGGKGRLVDIDKIIKERKVMNFKENPNWKASVRKTLEHNSSDSEASPLKSKI